MTTYPITTFVIRFQGGPLDGQTVQSRFTDAGDLPEFIEVDPGAERYELESASRLQPTRGVWRGAQYRHVESLDEQRRRLV